MRTKRDIEFRFPGMGIPMTVPAGTEVELATNLPYLAYWAGDWDDMTDAEESWARNYGFMIEPGDVESGGNGWEDDR